MEIYIPIMLPHDGIEHQSCYWGTLSMESPLSPHFLSLLQRNTVFSTVSLPASPGQLNARKPYPVSNPLLADVVHVCLQIEPSDRATASALLKHEYFTKEGFEETFVPELQTLLQQERTFKTFTHLKGFNTEAGSINEDTEEFKGSNSQIGVNPLMESDKERNRHESKSELKDDKVNVAKAERKPEQEHMIPKESANIVSSLPQESKHLMSELTGLIPPAKDLTVSKELPSVVMPVLNPNSGNLTLSSNLSSIASVRSPEKNMKKIPLHLIGQLDPNAKLEEGSIAKESDKEITHHESKSEFKDAHVNVDKAERKPKQEHMLPKESARIISKLPQKGKPLIPEVTALIPPTKDLNVSKELPSVVMPVINPNSGSLTLSSHLSSITSVRSPEKNMKRIPLHSIVQLDPNAKQEERSIAQESDKEINRHESKSELKDAVVNVDQGERKPKPNQTKPKQEHMLPKESSKIVSKLPQESKPLIPELTALIPPTKNLTVSKELPSVAMPVMNPNSGNLTLSSNLSSITSVRSPEKNMKRIPLHSIVQLDPSAKQKERSIAQENDKEINRHESKSELKDAVVNVDQGERKPKPNQTKPKQEHMLPKESTKIVSKLPQESKPLIPELTALIPPTKDLTVSKESPSVAMPVMNPNSGNLTLSSNLSSITSVRSPERNLKRIPLHSIGQLDPNAKHEQGSIAKESDREINRHESKSEVKHANVDKAERKQELEHMLPKESAWIVAELPQEIKPLIHELTAPIPPTKDLSVSKELPSVVIPVINPNSENLTLSSNLSNISSVRPPEKNIKRIPMHSIGQLDPNRKHEERSVAQESDREINRHERKSEVKHAEVNVDKTERKPQLEHMLPKESARIVTELPKESKPLICEVTPPIPPTKDLTVSQELPSVVMAVINPNSGNLPLSSNLSNITSERSPEKNMKSIPLHSIGQLDPNAKNEEGHKAQIASGKPLSLDQSPQIEKLQSLNKKKSVVPKPDKKEKQLQELPSSTAESREPREIEGHSTRPTQKANDAGKNQAEEDPKVERQDAILLNTQEGDALYAMLHSMVEAPNVGEYKQQVSGVSRDQVYASEQGNKDYGMPNILTQIPQISSDQSTSQIPQHMNKLKTLPRIMPRASQGSHFSTKEQETQSTGQTHMAEPEGFQQELLLNSMRQCQLMGEQNDIIREQTNVLRGLSQHLEAANSFQTTIARGISHIEMYSSRMNTTMTNLAVLNRGMVSQMIKAQEANAKNWENITALLERQENTHKTTATKTVTGPSLSTSTLGNQPQGAGSSNVRKSVTHARLTPSVKNPKNKKP
ncbi:uncharacterized protein LOC144769184 isoform X3 [Lissotriton helveticus]